MAPVELHKRGGLWVPADDTHFRFDLTGPVFQHEHLKAALAHVKNWSVAIDGGSHVGSWAMAMADKFDSVIAFEPHPTNFDCLSKNTISRANVIRIQAALGAEEMIAALHDPVDPGNSGARWIVDGGNVQVLALDSLALDNVGFLKLDVEGYEPMALVGATETIERCRPVILVEMHPGTARYGLPPDMAAQWLEHIGYAQVEHLGRDHVFVHAS